MKTALKTFVFTYISVVTAYNLFGSPDVDLNSEVTFLLVFGLSLLYLSVKPVIRIIGLSTDGFLYYLLKFGLTTTLLYVLSIFLTDLKFGTFVFPKLQILGIMLRSYSIDGLFAVAASGLSISLIYGFFDWISSKK